MAARFAIGTLSLCTVVLAVAKLPNTTGIDGRLTDELQIDKFFSYWMVFNNFDDVKMSDDPFTIFAPTNEATEKLAGRLQVPAIVKDVLLDHVLIGYRLDLDNVTGNASQEIDVRTASGKPIVIKSTADGGEWYANDRRILKRKIVVPKGILIVLDGFLFQDKDENATLAPAALPLLHKEETEHRRNGTFVENVLGVLSFLKSGVRVFQHFLSRSNVSRLLNDTDDYTVFVPTDHAFQRWHPIDWGFYPFSVPEFTESIITNHFVKGRLKQDTIKDGQAMKTMGGKEIIFRRTSLNLSVNGASIVKGDTPVAKGNIMFITEVLFVSESVVSKLHQQHRDKETPPLLAFPWFGAQFLSHAFLALERDKRFAHITRFLNLADLAAHVSGTGYTFFVPIDTGFEELGLDKMPDNYLSNGRGLEILLNHFVRGRLYDRDLVDGANLETLGNKTISIERKDQKVTVNGATIVQSEVFVYNLGTMFYIDKVLFATLNDLPSAATISSVPKTTRKTPSDVPKDIETIPEELAETTGDLPDILVSDDASTNITSEPRTENVSAVETQNQTEIAQ